MNRAVLEKPFDATQIRQRRGRTGGVLDYVEGHTVIARLNEAFEGAWSFEIAWHEIRETEVLVLGKLTAAGVTKCQFGSSAVTRDRETKQPVSLGDDLKAAGTDAMKKCATFLGVGLHLYAEKPLRGAGPPGPPRPPGGGAPRPPAPAPPTRPPAASASMGTPPGPSNTAAPPGPAGPARSSAPPARSEGHALLRGGRITPRQLAAIWRVARAKHLEPGAVEAMSLRVFNRKPAALTATEGTAFLKALTNLTRSVA
jgi:hypothetical protein